MKTVRLSGCPDPRPPRRYGTLESKMWKGGQYGTFGLGLRATLRGPYLSRGRMYWIGFRILRSRKK